MELAVVGPPPESSGTQRPTQPSICGAFAKCTKYKKDSVRWSACTDAVTKYMCKEMVSFNTVEKKSFKELLATLDSQYDVPGRTYFSSTAIPCAYNSVRSELQRTLTTDLWSSATMAPYMSLTVHFIDQDWKLVSKCLQTSFLPEDHTAVNLADALQDALREWELSADKVSCLTTDSGANIKAAVRNLGWPWLSCFGHNLNLAVSNTLEKTECEQTVPLQSVAQSTFSHSWTRRQELQKAQVELGLPHHSLVTVS